MVAVVGVFDLCVCVQCKLERKEGLIHHSLACLGDWVIP